MTHRYQRIEASPYVPVADQPAPIPKWKRMDLVKGALPERDARRIAEEPQEP